MTPTGIWSKSVKIEHSQQTPSGHPAVGCHKQGWWESHSQFFMITLHRRKRICSHPFGLEYISAFSTKLACANNWIIILAVSTCVIWWRKHQQLANFGTGMLFNGKNHNERKRLFGVLHWCYTCSVGAVMCCAEKEKNVFSLLQSSEVVVSNVSVVSHACFPRIMFPNVVPLWCRSC